MTGFISNMSTIPISWRSKAQQSVALLISEAECLEISDCITTTYNNDDTHTIHHGSRFEQHGSKIYCSEHYFFEPYQACAPDISLFLDILMTML